MEHTMPMQSAECKMEHRLRRSFLRDHLVRYLVVRFGHWFEAIGEFFLIFQIVVYHSLRVVTEVGRDLVSNVADAVNGDIFVGTHSGSPKSSIGVTSSGTYNPSLSLLCRI